MNTASLSLNLAAYGLAAGLISLLLTAGCASQLQPPGPLVAFEGQRGDYHGFVRHDVTVDGCSCIVVEPKTIAPGRPWIWRAEFFDAFPQVDLALLQKGFHLVFLDGHNAFGCPSVMAHWDAFYEYLVNHGLSRKGVLEGLSRGGLYVYNWGAANPRKVACIIGDNPVCDFKSWPGGKGKGPGSPGDWQSLIQQYGFKDEAEAMAYKKNPIDNLKPLAAAHVPVLHMAADADEIVPYEENTAILKQRYDAMGGSFTLILKKGLKHHPHGLDDPAPVVAFVLKCTAGR